MRDEESQANRVVAPVADVAPTVAADDMCAESAEDQKTSTVSGSSLSFPAFAAPPEVWQEPYFEMRALTQAVQLAAEALTNICAVCEEEADSDAKDPYSPPPPALDSQLRPLFASTHLLQRVSVLAMFAASATL